MMVRPASASSSNSRPSSGATRPPSATSSRSLITCLSSSQKLSCNSGEQIFILEKGGSRPGSGKSMALAAWDPLEEVSPWIYKILGMTFDTVNKESSVMGNAIRKQ